MGLNDGIGAYKVIGRLEACRLWGAARICGHIMAGSYKTEVRKFQETALVCHSHPQTQGDQTATGDPATVKTLLGQRHPLPKEERSQPSFHLPNRT